MRRTCSMLVILFTLIPAEVRGEPRVLDEQLHHLRNAGPREWDTFPDEAEAAELTVPFASEPNAREQSLILRQQDVKQLWHVLLNDHEIGALRQDENDMVVYLPIPAGALRAGPNLVRIVPAGGSRAIPDDIRVGQITIDPRPLEAALSEATVEVSVVDDGIASPFRPGSRLSISKVLCRRWERNRTNVWRFGPALSTRPTVGLGSACPRAITRSMRVGDSNTR